MGLTADEARPRATDERATPVPFEDFYLDHYRNVYAAMWLVTRDRHEAEEIAQDAFLRILERWDRVAEMEDPTGYLFRTATNVWRSRGRRSALTLRRAIRMTPPRDELEHVEARADVVRVLGRLTPRQRAAIVLIDLVGLGSEEA
jgi:RNA polymerase sigma-70 factor, ECF subfamily